MLQNKTIPLIMSALLATSCQAPALASWAAALRATCAQWSTFVIDTIKEYKQASCALAGLAVCAGIAHIMAYQVTMKRNKLVENKDKARKAIKTVEHNTVKTFCSIEKKQDQLKTLQKSTQEKEQALDKAKEAFNQAQAQQAEDDAVQKKKEELEQLQKQKQHLETAVKECEKAIAMQHERNNPENVTNEYEYWCKHSENSTQADQKHSK